MENQFDPLDSLWKQAWWSVLSERRSLRFCLGMEIPAGPLAYKSRFKPVPLSEEQEAALVYAAAGFTGPVAGDLSYTPDQGGGIMVSIHGRTTPSGDGIQNVGLMVVNDSGAFWIRRPQDFDSTEREALTALCQARKLVEFYRRVRVKIADKRIFPPKEPLFNLNVNRWSAHAAGTTMFVPVNDTTLMYLNGLLEVLGEQTGAYVLDERRGFLPAGLGKFARSKGGHLKDDPKDGCLVTVRHVEQLVTEFVTAEQGMMIQNLALMAESLGLGGFPSFANHEFGWFEAAGFEMQRMRASRFLGVPWWTAAGMRMLGKDLEVPFPYGLKRDGIDLLKPFCPPAYSSMDAAIDAVVELKKGKRGMFGGQGGNPSLLNPGAIGAGFDPLSKPAIDATRALASYLWTRYGRFPVYLAPYRTTLCFQAGHIDGEFYEKFYRQGIPGQRQREDFTRVERSCQDRLAKPPSV